MPQDKFADHSSGLESPATSVIEVTPSDTADLATVSRAINVAANGSVRLTTIDGAVATVNIAAGIAFPIRAARIWATGTTASGIVVMS